MTNIQIVEGDEFKKEFVKLTKKWSSLPDDFAFFIKALKTDPKQHIRISDLGDTQGCVFYKVKKFRCASIARASSKSWIRIIYRYSESAAMVEIMFIEVYHKNEKANHDEERIKKYLLP